MSWQEVNFDGLIGPTHNYAGLSYGNIASSSNRFAVSTPRAAALQGLAKMREVARLGVGQAVLPPQHRPSLKFLNALGFTGEPGDVIEKAYRADPALLAACYSASSMWTANAATVSASPDTADGRIHITPANLTSTLHRAIEMSATERVLSFLFSDQTRFMVHQPLPANSALADEGAANHSRLCSDFGDKGLELFVYGRDALRFEDTSAPERFPARQTLQASQAVARRHRLDENAIAFVKQNPAAVDAGAFHNDVVSVAHQDLLLFHESAFSDKNVVVDQLKNQFRDVTGNELATIEITQAELSLNTAIKVYLFNSQLVTLPDQSFHMICPDDCQQNPDAKRCLDRIIQGDNNVSSCTCLNLRQSMMNGGGPACLRLRIAMNQQQRASVHRGVMFSDELDAALTGWINKHYRESIAPGDLRDPKLIVEAADAMSELETILDFPAGLLHEPAVW